MTDPWYSDDGKRVHVRIGSAEGVAPTLPGAHEAAKDLARRIRLLRTPIDIEADDCEYEAVEFVPYIEDDA